MLAPVLRAIFAPAPTTPRKQPSQRAALQKRLRAAEAQAERLRGQFAALEPNDSEHAPWHRHARKDDRTLSTGPKVAVQPGAAGGAPIPVRRSR